jgi:hypothetical protein
MIRSPHINAGSLLATLTVSVLVFLSHTVSAQSTQADTIGRAGHSDSLRSESALEFGIGFGPAVAIGLARSLNDGVGLIGAKLSWAWEGNAKTFESNVWEPFILDLFYRRQLAGQVHVDIGPTLMSFASRDDQGLDGKLLGVYTSVWWGTTVYGGLEVRTGRLHSGEGSEFGAVVSVRVKAVINV